MVLMLDIRKRPNSRKTVEQCQNMIGECEISEKNERSEKKMEVLEATAVGDA